MAGRRRRILTIAIMVVLVVVYGILAYKYRARVSSTVGRLRHIAAGLKAEQALVSVVVYRLISLGLVVLVGSIITVVVWARSPQKKK